MPEFLTHNKSSNTDEKSLVKALCEQEEGAVSRLYDQYAGVLYGMITPLVQEEKIAGELLQHSILTIAQQIGSFDPSRNRLTIWMCQLTRKIVLEALDQQKEKEAQVIHSPEYLVKKEGEVSSVQGNGKLTSAMDLIWQQGYSYAEAATFLGMTISDLRKQVRRELKEFKAKNEK